jgi:hypothetical protein
MEFQFKQSTSSRDTARFVLSALSPDPKNPITLIVRHAGIGNEAFMTAVLAQQELPSRRNVLLAAQEARETDAGVFARTVVIGWENVTTRDGQSAPATPEAFERFLLQWCAPRMASEKDVDYAQRVGLYDRFRTFCRSLAEFRDELPDAETLGKG